VPPRERPLRRGLAFLLLRPDGAILFRRRPPEGLLGGMHELPSSPWREEPLDLDRALAHAPLTISWDVRPSTIRHGFTHFVLELALATGKLPNEIASEEIAGAIWCRPNDLHRLALPTLVTKVLRLADIAAPGHRRTLR
jgi:A/G-specific adenine glycosylase